MKYLLAGVLLFIAITSASAQSNFPNVGRVGGGSSLNSGSSLNGAASNGTVGSGVGSVSSNASKNVQATNPGEFVPSTFETYDAALSMGENARRARSLTLVEAARLAQQAKAKAEAKP